MCWNCGYSGGSKAELITVSSLGLRNLAGSKQLELKITVAEALRTVMGSLLTPWGEPKSPMEGRYLEMKNSLSFCVSPPRNYWPASLL